MACAERHASFCMPPSTSFSGAPELQLETRRPSATAFSRRPSAIKQTAKIRRQVYVTPVASLSEDTVIDVHNPGMPDHELDGLGSPNSYQLQPRTITHQKSRLMSTFTDTSTEEQSEDSISTWPLPGSLRDASRLAGAAAQVLQARLRSQPSMSALSGQSCAVSIENPSQLTHNLMYEQPGQFSRTTSRAASTGTGPSFTKMRTSSLQSAPSTGPKPAQVQSLCLGGYLPHLGMVQSAPGVPRTSSMAIDDSSSILHKLVDVEVHSLGMFAFKGLASHRQIAQLMPMSLNERLALFPHILKRGKATCVTANSQLLVAATVVLPDVSGLVLAR